MERVLSNKELFGDMADITIITTDQKSREHFFCFSPKVKMIDLEINYSDTNGQLFLQKLTNHILNNKKHKARLEKVLYIEKFDVVASMFETR